MTLPASGTISINDIRIELGVPSYTNASMLDLATGGVVAINPWAVPKPQNYAPYLMTAWYSYNHAATAPNITSFVVLGTTDTIYGGFNASWSYISGTSLNVTDTYLDYSFDYGATYNQFQYLSGTSTTQIIDSVEGLPGFTSLDDTYFRLRAYANGTQVPYSPLYAYPPFPY